MRAAAIRESLARPWVHGQAADLRGLTVTEPLNLSGMALSGADFSGTRFCAPVLAAGARFDGLSWFTGAVFEDKADFARALFINEARFDGARFAGPAGFGGAEFRGIARFDRAELARGGDFARITAYGNVSLDRTVFGGPADFTGGEFLGGFWCDTAHFDAGAAFDETQVHGRLWIRGATLGNAPLGDERFGLSFGYTYR